MPSYEHLHLSPHEHSGKRLPHHHTSYPALFFLLMMVGFVLVAASSKATADSYPVLAVVPGPPPQHGAVIGSPHSGQVFSVSTITVNGSCEPGTLVTVYKNQAFGGDVFCTLGGIFSLPIDLFVGPNALSATNIDTLQQAGPATPTINVTYQPPGVPTVASTNTAAPLFISAQAPFAAYKVGEPTSWSLSISGGTPPYAIKVDWGDGQTGTLTENAAGDFTLTHTYNSAGTVDGAFQITVSATDAKGQSSFVQLGAKIVGGAAPTTGSPLVLGSGYLMVAWPVFVITYLMVIGFWIGGHIERRHEEVAQLT